jgi:hypothetical protein
VPALRGRIVPERPAPAGSDNTVSIPRTVPAAANPSAAPYRLLFQPHGRLLEAARACEVEVFDRTYGNTAADLEQEYGAYEDHSAFVALATQSDEVVGIARLINPGPQGLKTVNDLSRPPWRVDGERAVRSAGADLARTWDVATLAVLPGRGVTPLAAAALYHGLVLATRANRVEWIVMMLDERARRLLSMAGFVPEVIPGAAPGPYLGSPATTPLVGNVGRMIDNQRRHRPDAHRLISLGVGLDGIAVPDLAEFRLSRQSTRPTAERPLAATA